MNYGRPIKIAFLWSRKFPLGCNGRVSKFPIQSLLSSMSIPTSFLPCNFCPALTGSTHNRPWRTPKNVDSPIWMLQYMPFEHLACKIGDFENECGNFYIKPCSLNTIYCHLFSAWIWTLDLMFITNGSQAMSRALDSTQRASFYDTNKWELLW